MTGAAARAVLGLALTATTTPAWGQPAGPPLTADERDVLRVIVECRKDPAPAHCAPFRPMVEYMRPPLAPVHPVPVIETAAPAAAAALPGGTGARPVSAEDRRDREKGGLDFAQGHGSTAGGQGVAAPDAAGKVSVEAATDTKTASLSLSFDLPGLKSGNPRALTITAEAPVGQDSTYTNIATLDGMTKSSTIGVKYTGFVVDVPRTRRTIINDPDYQESCKAIFRKLKAVAAKPGDLPDLEQPFACHPSVVKDLIKKEQGLPAKDTDLWIAKATELEALSDPPVRSLWMYSLGAEVGFDKHTWYDPLTLDKITRDRTPFEASAALTYVFGRGKHSTTLGYKFQRTYKDGGEDEETKTLCKPAGSPFLPCITGYIDRPLRERQHLFSADYRYISDRGRGGVAFGFNPTVTYDAQSGDYGVQVPIYLLDDKAKGLTGGIRYDWTSDEHESVVGLFVASSFCVLPGYDGCKAKEK